MDLCKSSCKLILMNFDQAKSKASAFFDLVTKFLEYCPIAGCPISRSNQATFDLGLRKFQREARIKIFLLIKN